MIKHHFFQRFEDFREESDRLAIVFVRRFLLLWIEVTLLIAQSICSTVSDQPLLFWLLLIVIFQTNMILKGEIANLQILLKLNTPGQSLFYVGEARVSHCCRHFLSITGFQKLLEQGRIKHIIKKEFFKEIIYSLPHCYETCNSSVCNAFVICCV